MSTQKTSGASAVRSRAAAVGLVAATLLGLATALAPSAAAAGASNPPSLNVPGLTAPYSSFVAPQLLTLTTNGQYLTNHGNSHIAGTTIDVWDRGVAGGRTQANQVWQFIPPLAYLEKMPEENVARLTSGAWGQLMNLESGMCLQLPSYSLDGEVPVTQATCDTNAANEKWAAVPEPGGYALQSALGTVYLGFNRTGCAQGAVAGDVMVARDPDGLRCATWQITPVVPMGGDLVQLTASANGDGSGLSNMVLDSNNPSGAWGVPAVTKTLGNGVYGTSTQQWYSQEVTSIQAPMGEDVASRYVNVPGGDWTKAVCLDVTGGPATVGASIETYGCDPNGPDALNQLWDTNQAIAIVNTALPALSSKSTLAPANGFAGGNQSPVATVTGLWPVNGSTLTLQQPTEPVYPQRTQIWQEVAVPAPAVSGSGSTTAPCVGYACVLTF